MNFAIVEDNVSNCQELKQCLKKWEQEHSVDLHIFCYKTGYELLSDNFQQMNLIFLDINLPDITGIEIAHRLRQDEYPGHIIFLTAFSEFVFEGYHVRALDYLLKPITMAELNRCLSHLDFEISPLCYTLQDGLNLIRIPFSTIIVFATQGHYMDIITTEDTYHQRISLKTIKSDLPPDFVQCHRTLIVNINHVTKLDSHSICLINGNVYPVSRPYLKQIQNAFVKCVN